MTKQREVYKAKCCELSIYYLVVSYNPYVLS
jgi:hypothetical protein